MVHADGLESSGGRRVADVGRHVSLARDDAMELDPCGVDGHPVTSLGGRCQDRYAFGGLPPTGDAPGWSRIEDHAADHGRSGRGRPPQHEPVTRRRGE